MQKKIVCMLRTCLLQPDLFKSPSYAPAQKVVPFWLVYNFHNQNKNAALVIGSGTGGAPGARTPPW